MQVASLGKSGLMVSRLCFGTLTMGPLQRGLSTHDGGALICAAAARGVDFFDTAQLYETYGHLAVALKRYPEIKISTKCYAYDEKTAAASLEKAQRELGREYIDLMMLHEQESEHTLRGHAQALAYFHRKKQEGVIGAVGISTHHIAAVKAAVKMCGVDVVHPIINIAGLGILDGTRAEMEEALGAAHEAGIGVFAMKALGGGHLLQDRRAALDYILSLPFVDAVAIGMQSVDEIEENCKRFEGLEATADVTARLDGTKRSLLVESHCIGCGTCVARCAHGALAIENGQAFVEQGKCVLCGYCAPVCKEFCLKVV